jgi:anti-sigma B factor antagonist
VIKDPAYQDSSFLMNSPSNGCSLFISPDSGEVPILNLVGEVDLGSAPKIYSLLWQTSEQGRRSLILNLEKLEFMDSSGLQILLRLREKLRAKKQNVLVVGPRPQILKLFKLTGLDQLFELVENNQEAKTIYDGWRQA